jgi:hypothetical protein
MASNPRHATRFGADTKFGHGCRLPSLESPDAHPALSCGDVPGLGLFAARLAPSPGVHRAGPARQSVNHRAKGAPEFVGIESQDERVLELEALE